MQLFDNIEHIRFMSEALQEAENALQRGDRPIGAVVVHGDKIIARASNSFETERSHLAHAELKALLACASYLYVHGHECIIYSTCEPCVMCLGAIVMANIRYVVFGMPDNYIRAREVIENLEYVKRRIHRYFGGFLEDRCIELYRRYSESETNLALHGR